MKHDENLLVVAMEESAELQQELSKAFVIFGSSG